MRQAEACLDPLVIERLAEMKEKKPLKNGMLLRVEVLGPSWPRSGRPSAELGVSGLQHTSVNNDFEVGLMHQCKPEAQTRFTYSVQGTATHTYLVQQSHTI